jgi:hypothetical protein
MVRYNNQKNTTISEAYEYLNKKNYFLILVLKQY